MKKMRLQSVRGLTPGIDYCALSLIVVGMISVFSAEQLASKSSGTVRPRGSITAKEASASPSVLKKSQAVSREITSGETHSYNIPLSLNQYVRAVVQCWGTNITVSVEAPSSENCALFDVYPDGSMPVSVIGAVSGEYVLKVTGRGEAVTGGRYEIMMEELRPAIARDRVRILAENALARAERLRDEWKTESSQKAIQNYQEARAYCQAAKDRRTEACVLRGLGRTYQSLDEYSKALAFYQESLLLSGSLSLTGKEDALNDIAALHCDMGDSQEALIQANRALRFSREANNVRGQARALFTCGEAYYGFGKLQKALECYGRALGLWRQLEDRQGQIKALVSFGYSYIELSNITGAVEAYNEALSISRAAKDLHSQAFTLRALGNLHTKLGEQQQALNSFLEALEILQSFDDRHLKATILGGLGYAYDTVSEKRRAIEYCEQSLALFKEIGHRWGEAEAEMYIGEIHNSLGEFEKALDNYHRAISLFSALDMPRYQAQTLRDMGFAYASVGDSTKALDCYGRSLALTRTGQDQRYTAYTLNYIGRVYEGFNEKQKALDYYSRALPLSRVAADPSGESLALYNIARLQRDIGNLIEARRQIEAAVTIAESQRTKVASRDLRVTYFASAHQYYELHIDVLMRLHKESPASGFDILALDASERASARALVDMLEGAHADISQGIDPALMQRKRILQYTAQARAERQMRLLSGQYNRDEAAALAKEIRDITTDYDEVESQIMARNPNYAELTQLHTLSLKEIQQHAVDDDALLLEYSLGEQRSYLWAVTRTGVTSYELPPRSEIEALANQFRDSLTAPRFIDGESFDQRQDRLDQSETSYAKSGSSLSRMLLGPAAALLYKKQLIIVADGALQYIPFGALPDPNSTEESPAPLMIEHQVTHQPSASTLATLRNKVESRQPASNMLAVFADPVFEREDSRLAPATGPIADDSPEQGRSETYQALRDVGIAGDGRTIPRLFASRDEANAILGLTSSKSNLKAIGFEANKALATGPELKAYRIIHFATHGVLDSESPELSGLVLSLFDKDGRSQDGFLRLNDIYNLDLPADLVVLSACNSALGKQIKGEGLIGLTRGFMYAGAARVMASLWKVDDEATAELIKHFYREMLVEKKSPAEALRQAQIAMWRQKRWRSPYFWAPFVLQGEYKGQIDSGQTPQKREYYLAILAASIIAILIISLYSARRFAIRRQRGSTEQTAGRLES